MKAARQKGANFQTESRAPQAQMCVLCMPHFEGASSVVVQVAEVCTCNSLSTYPVTCKLIHLACVHANVATMHTNTGAHRPVPVCKYGPKD